MLHWERRDQHQKKDYRPKHCLSLGYFRLHFNWQERIINTVNLWFFWAISAGAIMLSEWEKWDFLDSTYFCVTSLGKVGFGDLVPGADVNASNHGSQTKLVINFVYILLGIFISSLKNTILIFFGISGLGLVAMCYNLMREEIKVKLKELNEDFNQCLEDTKVRFLNCCRRCRRKKYQEYWTNQNKNRLKIELENRENSLVTVFWLLTKSFLISCFPPKSNHELDVYLKFPFSLTKTSLSNKRVYSDM